MYTVLLSDRATWPYEVTFNGGPTIARCKTEREADKVASALNAVRNAAQAVVDEVVNRAVS